MSRNQNNLFFPVQDVKYKDLYDWSNPKEKCKTNTGTVRLHRQTSASGVLVEVNEIKVALFRYETKVFGIDEKCPHAGGPLHVGDIEEMPDGTLCLRCPWHSWRFDLGTGKVKLPKGRTDKQAVVYPVKVTVEGTLWVGFDAFSPKYFSDTNF